MYVKSDETRAERAESILAGAEARGWIIRPGRGDNVFVAERWYGEDRRAIYGRDREALAFNLESRMR
jgi:hypothetical protein